MLVAIGSRNPAKVEGTRRAFAKYFPKLEVNPIDATTVAKAQPFGLEEIVGGAVKRANFALSQTSGDFGVGVEAGIFRIGSVYFDHQQAAVSDPSGVVTLGHSAGYMLPSGEAEEILKNGKELEQFAEQLSGIPDVGDKGGLIHYLTNGVITRTDLTEQCVLTALAPRLHKGVYGL